MRKVNLGHSEISVSAIGLGCMTMSDFYAEAATPEGRESLEEQSLIALQAALDSGCNLFDTADMYGTGHNERLLGRFFAQHIAAGGSRGDFVVASKFLVQRAPDGTITGRSGKPEYARQACAASLERLGLGFIDLYYLHGPDPDTPIEESVGGMAELKAAGKVRALGISNVTAEQIRRAHSVHPISAVQNEYSLWQRKPEEGVLQTCAELGISFVPYSPLARGFLTGAFRKPEDMLDEDRRKQHPWFNAADAERNARLLRALEEVATRHECTTVQAAIAWTISRGRQFGAEVLPIPGAKSAEHVKQNCASVEIELNEEELGILSV
jgi:aryl-alcohol dehydrogenase-like predicted oxidoreductase